MHVQFGNRAATIIGALLSMAAQSVAGEIVLIPEAGFMRPEVSFPITGARRTVLAPVDVETMDPVAGAIDREAVDAATRRKAADVLDGLEPEFHRDAKGVIEYAALASESPWVAMTILAPDFAKRFERTLGPEVLAVVPSRTRVFVFPKLATNIADWLPLLSEAYKATTHPVSLEVFEVGANGLRAVGVLEEP